jgi:hypothetical protein
VWKTCGKCRSGKKMALVVDFAKPYYTRCSVGKRRKKAES